MAESSLANPLLLDDYGVQNNDDITSLLTTLAGRSGANGTLHIKAPSTAMTLRCSPITFTGITKFAFLENGAAVTIQLNGTGSELWKFGNLYEFVIGTTTAKASRDDYLITLRGTWSTSNYGNNGSGYTVYGSMINIESTSGYTATGPLAFRCNTDRPKAWSFRWSASPWKVAPLSTIYIGGRHKGGCSTGYIRGTLHFENALFSDPFCRSRGWRGAVSGGLGVVSKVNAEFRSHYTQCLNAWVAITGSIEFAYGDPSIKFGFNDYIDESMTFGTSVDAPLVLTYRDKGYSGPEANSELGWPAYVKMNDPWWYREDTGKFDGLPQHSESRYIKMIITGSQNPPINWCPTRGSNDLYFTEADNTDAEGNSPLPRSVCYVTWILVNGRGYMDQATGPDLDKEQSIHHITYRGDGINPALVYGTDKLGIASKISLSIYDRAEWGQFYNISVDETGAASDRFWDRGSHNRIENCSITGKIILTGTGYDNVATNILFMGAAREVVNIASGQQFHINNVSAPAGSTIGGSGALKVNGVTKSLPYTIVAGDVTDAAAIPAEIPGFIETIQQVSRPVADVSNSGWTSTKTFLYDALDEEPDVDYSDYIFTNVPGSIVVLDLNDITNPETFSLHGIQYAGDGNYRVELLQNGSVIATRNNYDTSPTKHIEFLTTTEAQLIDQSYTNFQVRFTSL